MTNFQKRFFTAFVSIVLLFLVLILLPKFYFFCFMALALLVGILEWSKLIPKKNKWRFTMMGLFYFLLLGASEFHPLSWALVAGLLVNAWLWVAVLCYQSDKGCAGLNHHFVSSWIAVVFFTSFVLAVNYLRGDLALPSWWLCYPAILTWVVDSSAYFAGKSFGKHHLVTRVSPKKTWEGLLSGLLAGIIFAGLVGCFTLPAAFSFAGFLGLTVACIIASVFGDLSISVLKRVANVKDSGTLFPGHGGVLDRIDSLAPVMVVFAAGLFFFS